MFYLNRLPKIQNMQNKIGILGGTFNPIHHGHIALGTAAYEQFRLDKVLVMVSKTPPHKTNLNIPDAQVRSEMIKLAIKKYPFMEYSDFELRREGYIYTADTLTLLKEENPQNEYYFIVGGDSLTYIDSWYHPEVIFEKAIVLASGRAGIDDENIERQISRLKSLYPYADIRKIILPQIQISSSQIRKYVGEHKKIDGMVDVLVRNYMEQKRLYGEKHE